MTLIISRELSESIGILGLNPKQNHSLIHTKICMRVVLIALIKREIVSFLHTEDYFWDDKLRALCT